MSGSWAIEAQRRADAIEALRTHFAGKPYMLGRCDCARAAAWYLRKLGHKVTGFAKAGAYRSALTAQRALERAGFADLGEAVDSVPGLMRIAPAFAKPGDLMLVPGEGMPALIIYLDVGHALGFAGDTPEKGLTVIVLTRDPGYLAAWAV